MRPITRSVFGGLALAALLVVSTAAIVAAADPSPAPAGGPAGKTVCRPQRDAIKKAPTLEQLKAFGDCEIARRVTTLDALATRIADAKFAPADDAAHLTNEVRTTKNGLVALKAKIDAETEIDALKVEIRQIATDFRVYALVAPKVNLVLGADRVAAAEDRFDTLDQKLSDLIAQAEAAGKDVSNARAHLASMNAAVDKALALAGPIPNAVLPLTVAQFNAGTAGPLLADARTKLAGARTQLRTATAEAKACRDALGLLRDKRPAASPSVTPAA
jgi:hypothetical protein